MPEEKSKNIKITIEVKPNEIIWNSNADIMATVYYLDRVKYLIQQKTDELDRKIESKIGDNK